jgi:hypothetical protein
MIKKINNKYNIFFLISSIFFLVFFFLQAHERTIFLRDDYDVLRVLLNFQPKQVFLSHNEHFMPFLRIFYFFQYQLFGLDYSKYLAVQILVHVITGWVVFLLVKMLTKNIPFSFLAGLCFISTAGASYKIFVLMISQIWLFGCLFSSLSLYFFLKFYLIKRKSDFYLSLFFSLMTLSVSAIGIGLLLAISISTLVIIKKRVQEILLSLFLALFGLLFYLTNAYKSSLGAIKNNLSWLYPILVFRLIVMGIIWGAFLLLIFPWFNLLRPLPKQAIIRIGIAVISIILLVFFVYIMSKFIKVIKKNWQILFILSSFIFFHLGVIGLGRTANLGYALSPQYTYFPRLVLIVAIFYLFSKIRLAKSIKHNNLIIALLSCWIIFNQGLYFRTQMIKWEYRYQYTKEFLNTLGYVLKNQSKVLNLYCPDSISPVTKYSDMQQIFYPNLKVEYLDKSSVNEYEYLNQNKNDQVIYNFYEKAISGFDIDHY